ncbi:hypothetical protein [Rugamonas rubra]|uniref:Uncharacterized protein n=1 Tax=Rugamonas rubra TaxID=758825 RepID=A0A1I4UA55_9BURK|nr:hypothetical protein [Rugamonas rubra]SFM85879.1 hypothetical protein SAMN02982985_05563 [Rugamonas rubra]
MSENTKKSIFMAYEELPPPPKQKRRQVVELSGIDALRTLLWVRTVLRLADAKPSNLLSKLVFQVERAEFALYASAQRTPSSTTLWAVEEAYPVKDKAARPLAGTRTIYEIGPSAMPLWSVLAGNQGACETLIDDYLARTLGTMKAVSFDKKVDAIYAVLFEPHEADAVKEMLAAQPTPHKFRYALLLYAAVIDKNTIYHPLLDDTDKSIHSNLELVIVLLAAWQLSYLFKTRYEETDYLMAAAVHILKGMIPEVKDEIDIWFRQDLEIKMTKRFG